MDYKIDNDGVAIFTNFFPNDFINKLIDYFESNYNLYERRINQPPSQVDDTHLFANKEILDLFNVMFFERVYPLYREKFFSLDRYNSQIIKYFKMQKTRPTEGYHIWHNENEHTSDTINRVVTYALFLNTIEEGGELEFLYQSKRIKPVRNTLVLFPCNYVSLHRGNPPLKQNKLIATGWVETELKIL